MLNFEPPKEIQKVKDSIQLSGTFGDEFCMTTNE